MQYNENTYYQLFLKAKQLQKTMATHLFSLTNSHSLLIAINILGIYRLTNASFSWGVSILSSLNSLLALKAIVIVYKKLWIYVAFHYPINNSIINVGKFQWNTFQYKLAIKLNKTQTNGKFGRPM